MQCKHFSHSKIATVVGTILTGSMLVTPAIANEESDVEKITVTTQKRVQTLKEVPIAVSAFNEEFIEKANIANVKDLVDFTPGLHGKVTNDSFFDSTGIRGIITSDYGIGGDLSIGLYQDGVHQGRNGGGLSSFFDIARVEIARGPQGTLFGRNASAGAINVITNKPESGTEGSIGATIGQEGLFSIEGVYNTELSDNLYFRGGLFHEQEDNHVKNAVPNNELRGRDISALRASFLYDGIDNGEIRFTVNYEDRDMDAGIYRSINTLHDNRTIESDLGSESIDAAEIFSAVLDMEFDLGSVILTSQTAFKTYQWDYYEDYDGTAMAYGNYAEFDESDYISQEFRLSSNTDSDIYWFVGASYYKETINSKFFNEYDDDQFCAALPMFEGWEDDLEGFQLQDCHDLYVWGWDSVEYEGDEPTQAEIDAAVAEGYIPAPGDGVVGMRETVFADGDYYGWALFGDVTWSVNDKVDITFGGRYTKDTKEFALNMPEPDGWLGHYWIVGFHTGGEWVRDKSDWSEFTPRLAINYKLTDDVSLYSNYSRGYKSGGYNTFAFNIANKDWTGWSEEDEWFTYEPDGVIDETDAEFLTSELWTGSVLSEELSGTTLASFDPEIVDSFEVGLKGDFLDNRLKLNASLYYYDFQDFQQPFTQSGGIVIKNLGEAEGNGLELEMTADVTDDFQVYASYSYMDTEIVKGNNLEAENLKGLRLSSPESTFTLVGTYNWTWNDADMYSRVIYTWQDDNFTDKEVGYQGENNILAQEAYGITNLYLGASYDDIDINLFITNVTDEEYFEGAVIDTGYSRFGIGKPRQIGASIKYSF